MSAINKIKALIFDWGDTIMRDIPGKEGAMYKWDHVEWIPYAEEALKSAFPYFICCIATSADHSDREDMIRALKRVNADQYFHYFFSSKELMYKKPDTRFFTSIAEKLSIAPNECLMTGNLYEKDIIGAKQAGMHTVFFNETRIEGKFPDADHMIFSFSEFEKVLSEIIKNNEQK